MTSPRAFRTFLLFPLFSVLFLSGCGGGGGDGSGGAPASLQLGAHYYLWFPGNFHDGYLRSDLRPQQEPLLGEYNSRDPQVAENHIRFAKQAGLKFFTVDWWPKLQEQNSALDSGLLKAPSMADFKFCIFFETENLTPSKVPGITIIDEAAKNLFLTQMDLLADRYLSHPSYLKIDGRPVIILYLTRTMTGIYHEMIEEGRARLKARGIDPYFIGDEIYWTVTVDPSPLGAPIQTTNAPQPDRIRLFDAITAYNYYDGTPAHTGYGGENAFITDVKSLLQQYREATNNEIPVLPSTIPGYNDRGIRLVYNNRAIPRRFLPDQPEGSFFRQSLNALIGEELDARNPMGFITSWNEWNEDTAIEPLSGGEPTARDSRAGAYTEGITYSAFGTTYLEILAAFAHREP